MINDSKCGPDYSKCETDDLLNNFFGACAADANRCDEHIAKIKTNMASYRDAAENNRKKLIDTIVGVYKSARDKKFKEAKNVCTNNSGRDRCIESVCANNMENKCEVGFESEKSMAASLCNFYEKACIGINKK